MKLVNGKYSSVVQENGKPVNISFTAKFIDIFEHDKRWFARVSPLANSMATLNRVYAGVKKKVDDTIVVKVPYRYKRFECYVSKYGVASSVYELRQDDIIDCNVTMTHVDENVHWKFNNINIISLKES